MQSNGWLCDPESGRWYYLDANGAMLTGWQTVGDKEYYLDENGKCLMNTTTPDGSKVDENGAKIK